MGFLDKRSDREKEISEYYENRNQQINNGDINAQGITGDGLNTAIQRATQEDYDRATKRLVKEKSIRAKLSYVKLFFIVIFIASIVIIPRLEILPPEVGFIIILVLLVLACWNIRFGSTIISKTKRKRCKYPVKAKLEDVKKESFSKVVTVIEYVFTYKYVYSGKEYILKADKAFGKTFPKVGDEIQIFINENNPEDYCV